MVTVPQVTQREVRIGRRMRFSRNRLRDNVAGYLFISPFLISFLLFWAGPIMAAAWLSLTEYNLFTDPRYIGLENYRQLLREDPLFWKSLRVTAIYSVGSVVLQIVFGLALALLLNQQVRGMSVYRTIFYLPAVVSGVAVAYMWVWVFNPEAGIANQLLGYIGIDGPNWFFNLRWVLPTFILMSVWNIGGSMVLYLAGLQGVPTALYEAAALDGAGWWRKFVNITIPMISPVIFFNFIIGMISSFQVFTNAFVITEGGPANATLFYVLYLYRNAFESLKMGYASALAMVLFAIILVLTIISFRLSRRVVHYES